MEGKNKFRIVPALIAAIASLLVNSFGVLHAAPAASLFFSVSSSNVVPGSTITVSVRVSSADQSMNAASGIISFPVEKLEVLSISKTGSIFSFWAEEPIVSKTLGTISFEGIILNPGFSGTDGRILTITFKAKTAGTADIRFISGSVLANDGEGTKLATTLGSARITVGQTQPADTELNKKTVSPRDVPDAPTISSPTHPDPTKSYNNAIARFSWPLPQDATAVRILYSKIRDSSPTVTYRPPILEKQLEKLPDGTYFFHAQIKNDNGWSAATHFRFQIDTTTLDKPTGGVLLQDTPDVYGTTKLAIENPITFAQELDPIQNSVKQTTRYSQGHIASISFMSISVAVILYALYEIHRTRKCLRTDITAVRFGLSPELIFLKEAIKKQIKMLEKIALKRELTMEEEKILGQLKRSTKPNKKTVRTKR